MKIRMNITKKHLYIISGLIAALAIAILVPADPDIFGHGYKNLDLGILTIDKPTEKIAVDGDMALTGELTVHKIETARRTVIGGDLEVEDNDLDDCVWEEIPAISGTAECSDGKYMAGFDAGGTWSIYCCEI